MTSLLGRRSLNNGVTFGLTLLTTCFCVGWLITCNQTQSDANSDGGDPKPTDGVLPVPDGSSPTDHFTIICQDEKSIGISCDFNQPIGCETIMNSETKNRSFDCELAMTLSIDPTAVPPEKKMQRRFLHWIGGSCDKNIICRTSKSCHGQISAVFSQADNVAARESPLSVRALWASSNITDGVPDYWLAGENGLLAHRDKSGLFVGAPFVSAAKPGPPENWNFQGKTLLGIAGCQSGSTPSTIWAVGEQGLLLHYSINIDGSGSWHHVGREEFKNEHLQAVWTNCVTRTAWVAGTNGLLFSIADNETITHRQLASPNGSTLHAIWGSNDEKLAVAVGDQASVLFVSDKAIKRLDLKTMNDAVSETVSFRAILGSGASEKGTAWIAHYDGGQPGVYQIKWDSTAYENATVTRIDGPSKITALSGQPDEIWALQEDGTLYKGSGTPMESAFTKVAMSGRMLPQQAGDLRYWILQRAGTGPSFNGVVAGDPGVFRF